MATESTSVPYGQPLPPREMLPTMYDLLNDFGEPNSDLLPPCPPRAMLPTMYDLPSEEIGDAGMPDEFHVHQAVLLNETFHPTTVPAEKVFAAVDMNLYYDRLHTGWYKRPDWFGVIGATRFYAEHDLRMSYVIWQEQVTPLVVVEMLSPGTEEADLGQNVRAPGEPPPKWEVYERLLRVPYYIVFSRYTDELHVFKLMAAGYEERADEPGRVWLAEAGLGLGLWYGRYANCERLWLRWYDDTGNWIPTAAERAEQARQDAEQAQQRAAQERQRAEQEQQRAQQERQRAEQERQEKEAALQKAQQLAAKLRALGIDPDQL